MNVAYEQSVFGFDLDFLHEPSNDVATKSTSNLSQDANATLCDNSNSQSSCATLLQNDTNIGKNKTTEKGLAYLKKKIINIDCLVRDYKVRYEQILDLEKNLLTTKEKFKEACIERDQVRQKNERLEKECQHLRACNQELQRKLIDNDHINAATESHTRQLQLLIKERDAQIDAYRTDKNVKLNTIKGTLAKKEKIILAKYMRLKRQRLAAGGIEKASFKEPLSDCEAIDFDDDDTLDTEEFTEVSPSKSDITHHENQNPYSEKDVNEDDIDKISESVSVDTGRGSSLAFSSSEINSNSPKYFIDSPSSESNDAPLESLVDESANSSTSPVNMKQSVDMATSPILSDEIHGNEEKNKPHAMKHTEANMTKTIDTATSPIKVPNIVVPHIESIDGMEPALQKTSEFNNSSVDDNSSDCEVESILNSMQLNFRAITPIPPTPSKTNPRRCMNNSNDYNECPLAAKVCEEFKVLRSAVAELAKVVLNQNNKSSIISIDNDNSGCLPKGQVLSSIINSLNDYAQACLQEQSPTLSSIIGNQLTLNNDTQACPQRTSPVISTIEEIEPLTILTEKDDTLQECSQKNNSTLVHKTSDKLQFEQEQYESPTVRHHTGIVLEQETRDTSGDINTGNKIKPKKLTRLEKLRKTMMPKSKIKKDFLSPRLLRSQIKKVSVLDHKVGKTESAATLNSKDVYERAVKVMAEIKSQQKINSPKRVCQPKDNSKDTLKQHISDNVETTDILKMLSSDDGNDNRHENISAPVSNNDTCVTDIKNMTSKIGCGSFRRESFTPEIENILAKSRVRYPSLSLDKDVCVVLDRAVYMDKSKHANIPNINNEELLKASKSPRSTKKCNKREAIAIYETENAQNKRILRSSVRNLEENNNGTEQCDQNNKFIGKCQSFSLADSDTSNLQNKLVSYNDLDIFNDNIPPVKKQKRQDIPETSIYNPQESIFCKMIDKYGFIPRNKSKKRVPESVAISISLKIAENIATVIQSPQMEANTVMNEMILDMEKWKFKDFLAGLMQYLMDSTRSLELLSKVNCPPAPPTTKSEQVLLYMVTRLNWENVNTVDSILKQIEYALFRLNQTPELRIIESVAHFYSVLCRSVNAKSRLRIFVLNAMYCMQYGAVALIKQCFEVWMHILPLAHMGAAKNPLIIGLVYLLHYFKSEDKGNKVQDVRTILRQKYFFNVTTDWNESKILEMFKNAILDMKDDAVERKMLRLALVLMSKRHGPKWCQKHIINNMLLQIIAMDKVSERVKAFCVSLLGPLLKPYPENMKVHCVVVINQLIDNLTKHPSQLIEEAIYSSLICLSKHNQTRVLQVLLMWRPKQVSPHMERAFKDYIKEKPLNIWKNVLSRIPLT